VSFPVPAYQAGRAGKPMPGPFPTSGVIWRAGQFADAPGIIGDVETIFTGGRGSEEKI